MPKYSQIERGIKDLEGILPNLVKDLPMFRFFETLDSAYSELISIAYIDPEKGYLGGWTDKPEEWDYSSLFSFCLFCLGSSDSVFVMKNENEILSLTLSHESDKGINKDFIIDFMENKNNKFHQQARLLFIKHIMKLNKLTVLKNCLSKYSIENLESVLQKVYEFLKAGDFKFQKFYPVMELTRREKKELQESDALRLRYIEYQRAIFLKGLK